jgi:hypothetical protein
MRQAIRFGSYREIIFGMLFVSLLVIELYVLYNCADSFNSDCHLVLSRLWPVVSALEFALEKSICAVSVLVFFLLLPLRPLCRI